MGIYLNPNNKCFLEAISSEIYVDKTGMITYTNKCLNTNDKFICVSRPRRFGKSMTINMLSAYYSNGCNSKEMFTGYKISKNISYHEHINKYNVIFLNMKQFLYEAGIEKMTDYLEQVVIEELHDEYKELLKSNDIKLSVVLRKIYAKTDKPFVFLIDEWDCIMREKPEADELQKQYLDFLQNLLKDQAYVALAYITGILPVKKYGTHSALNMFREFSMTNPMQLEEYVGFTKTEVLELCQKFNMDFNEISQWYDGYSFIKFTHIYNPKAVVESLLSGHCSNYWTSTETYEALKIYIDMNYDGLRESVISLLGKEHIEINTKTFRNDMKTFQTKDDVLTLLIHLGYLAYDEKTHEVFIPNKEIAEEFESAMTVSGWQDLMKVLKASDILIEDTLTCKADNVANALDRAHTEVSSVLTYNDENSMSCAINLAYYSAKKYYLMLRELPTGRGFADIVFLPYKKVDKPALVIELKYDKNAYTAIQQIKEKHYTQALENYSGKILLVGISYDKKTKKHSCIIEEHVK